MRATILLLNFGEPEEATPEAVVPFLERILAANASLDGKASRADAERRSRELAARRAPGLIEEYRAIGGSPLNRQARAQATALEREMARRGVPARVLVGTQYADPLIPTAIDEARRQKADTLLALPVYPLCGPSTTVTALETVAAEVKRTGWTVRLMEISGWHRHPAYIALRADAIRECAAKEGSDPSIDGTRLVFSAHGTPLAYLRDGSRYVRYVEDCCSRVAAALGGVEYLVGYQNHSNREIPWTEPEIGEALRGLADQGVESVLLDAISFMHEGSETLAELDIGLRETAAELGIALRRVPVPHDAPEFTGVLADLAEAVLRPDNPSPIRLQPCACRASATARCLNGVSAA